MNKTALICGVGGQDGAYLARLLLTKGYAVYGSSRDAESNSFRNLRKLGILGRVNLVSLSLNDFRSILQILVKIEPDEIYNLAGQSSVGLSFQQPVETFESISVGTVNLLEAIRFVGKPIRFYNASSVECFGDTETNTVTEKSPFHPRSPYAVAKAAAFWQVANYREAYHLFACSGLLSNHESPLRAERFVTQKIVTTAKRIAAGSREKLVLGNIDIIRDWGWAPEYVEAMWLMLQRDDPDDYLIATGKSYSLQQFIEETFRWFKLDWREYVTVSVEFSRPTDISISLVDPSKAKEKLGWVAKFSMPDVVRLMKDGEKT